MNLNGNEYNSLYYNSKKYNKGYRNGEIIFGGESTAPIIIEINLTQDTTTGKQFIIIFNSLSGGSVATVKYDNKEVVTSGLATLEFDTIGIKTIEIFLSDGSITFPIANSNRSKLNKVIQWGSTKFRTMKNMFLLCQNLTEVSLIDQPDLSLCSDFSALFSSTISFDSDISNWDVSTITNMSDTFLGTNFNQNLSTWDVSNVTNMSNMFTSNYPFNQDLSTWDVSNVTDMSNMFSNTGEFNQDLSSWNFNINVKLDGFLLNNYALSTINYNNLLVKLSNIMVGSGRVEAKVADFGYAQYSGVGEIAKQQLINDGWVISDGGLA